MKFKFPAVWCFWLRFVVPWIVCRCVLFCLTVGETYANFPCAAMAFISRSIGSLTSCRGLCPRYFSPPCDIFRLVSCAASEINGEILAVWSLHFLSVLLILIVGGTSAVLSIWRCSVYGYCLVSASLRRLVSISSCLIGVNRTCCFLLCEWSPGLWPWFVIPETWLITFFLGWGISEIVTHLWFVCFWTRAIKELIRATTWWNVSSGVSDQARHKSAYTATEAS